MLLRIGALALAAAACAGAASGRLTPAERQLNIDSFEHVWKTVRDRHWDPKLGGLDWQAVHDELRPKIEQAAGMDEARAVMTAMLQRLGQTHFAIVPSEAYGEMDSQGPRDGDTGMDVRVLEGQPVVISVEPASPAAGRGVKPGWRIVRIGGKEIAPSLRRIEDSLTKSTMLQLILTQAVASRLAGKPGVPVRVDFLNGDGRTVELEIDRARPRGAMATLGYLPPMYFWVESRKLRPDIGYVRFNIFFEPDSLVQAFEKMVKACGECRGFVIDLRGNPGGIGGLAMGVAGWFIDTPGLKLGTMVLRDSSIRFAVFPRPRPFRGPLAVLVDGCSASTSEIFAGGLQDLKRARIFGTRTAGAALPSTFERLPNGDGFQYAIANYISEGGKPLEGVGVVPDEEVSLTPGQLLAGRDPVLDAAVSWIRKR